MHTNGINSTCAIATLILAFLMTPVFVYAADRDNDGLSDEQEAYYLTDPTDPDTDADGHADGLEIRAGYSPLGGIGVRMHEHDADNDGLNDWLEDWFGTNLGAGDTDGDGVGDYEEVVRGYSPTSSTLEKQFDQHITVDLSQQRVYLYTDGVKIHNFPVSTGNPGTPTPVGEFSVRRKIDIKPYIGVDYYLPNVTWNMEFLPMYYLHTAYWHNDFGKRTHSHGCVNMREADAKVLYDASFVGMKVNVIGETPKRYVVEQ